MYKIGSFLILFSFIFSPFIEIKGYGIVNLPIYLAIVLAVLGFLPFVRFLTSSKSLLAFVFLKMIAVFYYLLVVSSTTQDYSSASMFSLWIIMIPASFFIIEMYKKSYSGDYIVKIQGDIVLSIVAHGLIVLSAIIFPEFLDLLLATFEYSEKTYINVLHGHRFPGLLYEGHDGLALVAVFAFIINYRLVSYYSIASPVGKYIIAGVFYLVIIISSMFAARIGFFIISVGVVYAIINFREGVNAVILSILGVIILTAYYNLSAYNDIVFLLSNLRDVFSVYAGGAGEIDSVSNLREHVFFSSSFSDIIFGTGDFLQGHGHRSSDIGYIIVLNGLGVVGMMLVFMPYYIVILERFILNGGFNFKLYPPLVPLIIILLLVNFKNFSIDKSFGVSQVFYLILSLYFYNLAINNNVRKYCWKVTPE